MGQVWEWQEPGGGMRADDLFVDSEGSAVVDV